MPSLQSSSRADHGRAFRNRLAAGGLALPEPLQVQLAQALRAPVSREELLASLDMVVTELAEAGYRASRDLLLEGAAALRGLRDWNTLSAIMPAAAAAARGSAPALPPGVEIDFENFALRKARFMWPKTGPGPWDKAGAMLVKELSRTGWSVEGWMVRIGTYGSGSSPMRVVRSISGRSADGPFEIRFGNAQGCEGDWNITTGVCEATVPPGLEAHVYSDDSDRTACLYTGTDWPADGEAWIRSSKFNSRLDGTPKRYLKYHGRKHGTHMQHDQDMGREHSPDAGEPDTLAIRQVDADVERFMMSLVGILQSMPSAAGHDDVDEEGDANLRRMCTPALIPVPDDFPALYCHVEYRDAYRALRPCAEGERQRARDSLVSGNGWRLASLGVKNVPERAHDGFDYASDNPSVIAGQVIHGSPQESLPVRIDLSHLNEIYVVDNAAFRHARTNYWDGIAASEHEKHRVPDRALDEWVGATARTMVPAHRYDGSYEEPVYLIGRMLGSDECRPVAGAVRLITGGTHAVRDGEVSWVEIEDRETGICVPVCEPQEDCPWTRDHMRRTAARIAELLTGNSGNYAAVQATQDKVPARAGR